MKEAMEESVVTRKGQMVIPARLRKRVGIKEGTKVFLEEKNGDLIIHPATAEFYDRTFGFLKGGGLTKALEESRRADNEREEWKIERR